MTSNKNPIMVLAGIERSSRNLNELLNRLNNYGRAFQALVKKEDAKLTIFASYWNRSAENELKRKYEYLEITAFKSKPWQLLKQTRLLFCLIKFQGGGSRLLISGDPMAGFLVTLFLNLISFGRHKIQVQFHGDIYRRPDTLSAKAHVRWILAQIQMLIADSIRVVSQHQFDDLIKIYKIKSTKVFIAPIPLDPIYFSADLAKNRVTVGFIGRIHLERGVEMQMQIISGLLEEYPNIKIHIIGDGPEKRRLEKEFQDELLMGKIAFLGWLTKQEVLKELETMKILISTAQSEGYGLAIREAIMAGVHVIANDSAGVIAALKDFPEHITVCPNAKSTILAIRRILNVEISTQATERARRFQVVRDKLGVETLIMSWK